MAEAGIKPHRTKNPHGCERCREARRHVDAEWNLKPEGKPTMYLCGPHARYWAAQYGIEFAANEPLVATA